jgi:hypothetical protein
MRLLWTVNTLAGWRHDQVALPPTGFHRKKCTIGNVTRTRAKTRATESSAICLAVLELQVQYCIVFKEAVHIIFGRCELHNSFSLLDGTFRFPCIGLYWWVYNKWETLADLSELKTNIETHLYSNPRGEETNTVGKAYMLDKHKISIYIYIYIYITPAPLSYSLTL